MGTLGRVQFGGVHAGAEPPTSGVGQKQGQTLRGDSTQYHQGPTTPMLSWVFLSTADEAGGQKVGAAQREKLLLGSGATGPGSTSTLGSASNRVPGAKFTGYLEPGAKPTDTYRCLKPRPQSTLAILTEQLAMPTEVWQSWHPMARPLINPVPAMWPVSPTSYWGADPVPQSCVQMSSPVSPLWSFPWLALDTL